MSHVLDCYITGIVVFNAMTYFECSLTGRDLKNLISDIGASLVWPIILPVAVLIAWRGQ